MRTCDEFDTHGPSSAIECIVLDFGSETNQGGDSHLTPGVMEGRNGNIAVDEFVVQDFTSLDSSLSLHAPTTIMSSSEPYHLRATYTLLSYPCNRSGLKNASKTTSQQQNELEPRTLVSTRIIRNW